MIHIITPEYPPRPGGVADYVRQLAHALASSGEEVHVWCPAGAQREAGDPFLVHGTFEKFREADLRARGMSSRRFPGRAGCSCNGCPTATDGAP